MTDTSTREQETHARLLAELDLRLQELGRRLDQLVSTMAQAAPESGAETPQPAPAPGQEEPPEHLLFVPTPAGYELIDQRGAPPKPGEMVQLPGHAGTFLVAKVGPSPLPGDGRPCAYLQLT